MAHITASAHIDLILPDLDGIFQDIIDYWTFEPTSQQTVDFLVSVGIDASAATG